MIKPKVALVKDGFLPAGSENKRGRLSAAAIERCKVLAAPVEQGGKGWQIEGYEAVKSSTPDAPPVVNKVKVSTGATEIADIGEPFRHEEAWEAFTSEGPVGMRTVCNTCHSSLTYCPCQRPVVNIDHMRTGVVSFKPRTTPLPAKRW